MHFLKRNGQITNLIKNLSLLKLPDKVIQESRGLICKYFNQASPLQQLNTHNTRWSNSGCYILPSHNTKLYGRQSVNISTIFT